MKNFGGDWTETKIEILIEYAKAYLVIMNSRPYWKLIYFDGFAGSGHITNENSEKTKLIHGSAKRILELKIPKPFDMYYFVEKDDDTYYELINNTKKIYPDKIIYPVKEDCNLKLTDMSDFLRSDRGKNHKVLAYVDPFGMQLSWEAINTLKSTPVDLWVLVPTGLGVNRLLKKDGKISDGWYERLELFLGLTREQIDNHFYREKTEMTLFGEVSTTEKETDAINRIGLLYQNRLGEIFKYVSNPYLLKNSQNSTMFHFFMASNNKVAVNIANDIIKKYTKK